MSTFGLSRPPAAMDSSIVLEYDGDSLYAQSKANGTSPGAFAAGIRLIHLIETGSRDNGDGTHTPLLMFPQARRANDDGTREELPDLALYYPDPFLRADIAQGVAEKLREVIALGLIVKLDEDDAVFRSGLDAAHAAAASVNAMNRLPGSGPALLPVGAGTLDLDSLVEAVEHLVKPDDE